MTGDVLMAALTITRERVRRSVLGVIGALWLACTLGLVGAIVPVTVDKESKESTTAVYWAKWLILEVNYDELSKEPPEGYPEDEPWPPQLEVVGAQLVAWGIANWILAWVGIAFVVMVTCDYFTGAMERGRVELLLARPLPRSVVLLAHYGAGVLFAASLFTPVILLSAAAIWARTGVFLGGFLLTIPILVGMYGVLHAIQTLAASAWRSWFLALLVPVVIWFSCFGVEKVRGAVKTAVRGQEAATELAEKTGGENAVRKIQNAPMQGLVVQAEMPVDVVYHALPKLSEFDNLNVWAIYGRAELEKDAGEDYNPWVTILSSAAWMVGCLGLACLLFHFREF